MNQRQFDKFRRLTHDLTGVSIAETRRSMLTSRVGRRMRALAMECLDDYYSAVLEDPSEQAMFVDKVTTHETYFFRTDRVWDYLQHRFLPQFHANNPGAECRVWSAAASTGEEAYSVAMMMDQYRRLNPSFRYSVFASDISEEVIKTCQAGVYSGRPISRLKQSRPEFFRQYFEEAGDGFKVVDLIKNNVKFAAHNLFDTGGISATFDLVLCRNVLIYFNQEDQRQVLNNVRTVIADGGVLIIGEAENLPQDDRSFLVVEALVYQASRENDVLASPVAMSA
ncbi:MAG: protein-glutamate O-methyltransferase CheR [Lysobacterales bacterium]